MRSAVQIDGQKTAHRPHLELEDWRRCERRLGRAGDVILSIIGGGGLRGRDVERRLQDTDAGLVRCEHTQSAFGAAR